MKYTTHYTTNGYQVYFDGQMVYGADTKPTGNTEADLRHNRERMEEKVKELEA